MKVVKINRKSKNYTVYIGRSGQGLNGPFGNPVKMNSKCPQCGDVHQDRGSTLPCFEIYLRAKLENSSSFRRRFMQLQEDDILGCFCKPDACHGDVIVRVWEELNTDG